MQQRPQLAFLRNGRLWPTAVGSGSRLRTHLPMSANEETDTPLSTHGSHPRRVMAIIPVCANGCGLTSVPPLAPPICDLSIYRGAHMSTASGP